MCFVKRKQWGQSIMRTAQDRTGGRRERPTAHAGPCVYRHPGTGCSTPAPHGLNTRHPGHPQGMLGTSPAAVSPPRWHGRSVRSEWSVAENAKQHIKMNLISGNSASLSRCRFAPGSLRPQTSQSPSRLATSSNSWNFWLTKPFGLQ